MKGGNRKVWWLETPKTGETTEQQVVVIIPNPPHRIISPPGLMRVPLTTSRKPSTTRKGDSSGTS